MNKNKNEIIAFVLISCILTIMIFIITPLNEITLNHFGGVSGVLGYLVVKKIVDAYFAQKESKKPNR